MRTLTLIACFVLSTTGLVQAERIVGHYQGSHSVAVEETAGCQHCQGANGGSLDDYPGGCCRGGNGACCAGLWANYCAEKKPCWTPHARHRYGVPHLGPGCLGCGVLNHPCLTGCCKLNLALPGAKCGCDQDSCTSLDDDVAVNTEANVDPYAVQPAVPAEEAEQGDAALEGDDELSPAGDAEEAPEPSALRSMFPFTKNMNPKELMPSLKRPTAARPMWPFSR